MKGLIHFTFILVALTVFSSGCSGLRSTYVASLLGGNNTNIITGSPTLNWTTSTFDFAARTTLNTSESIFMVLENSGTAAATSCSAPTLTNSTDFEISIDNCGTAALPAGGTCTIAVRAKPQTNGIKTTSVSRVCGTGGTVLGTLNGITTTAGVGAAKNTTSDGDYNFGTISLTKNSDFNFFFTNAGTADATGCSAPTLDNTTDFTILSDGCGTADLPVNQACKVTVRFAPGTTGQKNNTLYRSCAGVNYQTYFNGLNGIGTLATTPIQLSGSSEWMCSLMANGTVRCWGDAGNSGTGDGNSGQYVLNPAQVANITTATSINVGRRFACAVLSNQTMQCWGDNSYGQIGDGTTTDRLTSVAVSSISTAVAVTAGEDFACALLANNTVQCWGNNDVGQLGNASNTNSSVPVSVSGITTATAITAQAHGACALLSNNTVQCWGLGSAGQLGNGVYSNSNIPVTVTGISTATKLGASESTTCAILTNNTIQCWGAGGSGNLGDGTENNASTPVAVLGITTATALTQGSFGHICAILADTSIRCWGNNDRRTSAIYNPIT